MLTQREKNFFLQTARGASKISDFDTKRGAVLVKGNKLLSTGYNRRLIKGQKWEISAIYDAIFSARDIDISDTFLFSTYFPDIDDMKLIITVGIKKLYFFGPIDNQDTVKLMNSLTQNLIPLEILQVE